VRLKNDNNVGPLAGVRLPRAGAGAAARGAARHAAAGAFLKALLAALLLLIAPAAVLGQTSERYDYDPLGRLIRVIDAQGRVTEYEYDAAGNIRAVRTGGSAGALVPTITNVTPAGFRKSESVPVTVTGTNFVGARLNSADPEIDITGVAVTATQFRFTVSATASAAIGAKTFSIANAAGSASFSLTLAPPLPQVVFNPQPIAIPPDSAARTFNIVLSNADTIAHTIDLAIDNTAVATVTPASVTLVPGQTVAAIQVTGRAGGLTTLRSSSATLGSASAPVFVTADFAGVRTAYAPFVGVLLPAPPTQNLLNINGMLSPAVGVTVGAFVRAVGPRALVRGQTTTVTVTGGGLQGVTGLSFAPSAGIGITNVVAAADGLSVTADVAVAADAPVALRQIVLAGSAAPYRPSSQAADRVWIVEGLPVTTSIDPFQVAPGMNGITLRVRGRNLTAAEQILVPAISNVRISNAFTVNADGTEITGGMEVPFNARIGSYPVQVATPAGASDAALTAANTLQVVNEITSVFTPLRGALVGVVNGPPPQVTAGVPLFSATVGIAVGTSISAVSPRAGSVGQVVTLVFGGFDLAGVTALQVTPATGITVSTPIVAADGASFRVDLTIAADAPRTLRRLRVLAGTTAVPFTLPELAAFLVTEPTPEVHSVAPIVLRTGQPPLTFSVRGRNLQGATAVRFVPAADIVVGSNLAVNAAGTEATVSVTVPAGAANGQRVVVLETPAGASSTVATVANTVTITDSVAGVFDAVTAPLVGVQNGPALTPQPVTFDPIVAPLVGVVIEQTPQPPAVATQLHAQAVGVALGAIATGLAQTPLVAGASGTLTVTGLGLDAVTGVTVGPAAGVTIGTISVNAQGTQLTVPVDVAAATASAPRTLRLLAGSTPVQFVHSASPVFFVAAAAPRIDSIEPLFGRQGEWTALLIRGANLHNASQVLVEPQQGVTPVTAPAVNSTGTEATVSLRIAPDAALGGRVIRIVTPGGTTSAAAEPANTFTVFAP
jgi:YD repeat-containing protein